MRKYIIIAISVILILTLATFGFVLSDYSMTENQLWTLFILGCITLGAILYCFIVGEIANNFSQMDKLWSILPIVYAWVVTIRSGFKLRMIIMAAIITLWGIRLTINFARKGAYSIKFWTGEEDYRWAVLRSKKPLNNRFLWALFDLFFISFYQNVLVLAICLPMVAAMESEVAFGIIDGIGAFLAVVFLAIETIADEQQWKFHKTKRQLLSDGKSLSEIDAPYNLGFNTTGLWGFMRHPNYLGEQGIWLSMYIFVIGAGVARYAIFNWSMAGSLFLVLLFIGSSTFGEAITSSKYPMYAHYMRRIPKYLIIRKYNPNK